MYEIMIEQKSTLDYVLDQFSEYIEDPHGPELVVKILNIFISELPNSQKPQKYIRYVLNRIHLDDSIVRSAAISCLGELGLNIDSLRKEITSVLLCFQNDTDNEVRERACYYLNTEKFAEENKKKTGECFTFNEINQIESCIEAAMGTIDDMSVVDLVNSIVFKEEENDGQVIKTKGEKKN